MAIWNSVHGLKDGENVDAATFNRPLSELAARTDYLKEQIERGRQDDASVKITVGLSENDTPEVGDVVCLDLATKKYVKAVASSDLLDAYVPSERAFAIGILTATFGLQGTVVIYGKVDISEMNVFDMTDDEAFENGQYYLSSHNPGRITRYPSGPKISIGMFTKKAQANGKFVGDFAILNPQYMDIEAHTHRTYALYARPCGESVNTDEYYKDDELSESDVNTVSVVGYPPIGGIPEAEGVFVPRLVVGGEWTSSDSETYEIVITGPTGDAAPSSWPCYVKWRVLGSEDLHYDKFRFFGDEINVGDYGMTVKLEPSGGMSESVPFVDTAATVGEDFRTWRVGRNSGRGWSKFDINKVVSTESGGVIRISGSPDMRSGKLKIVVPNKVYKVYDGVNQHDGFENVVIQNGDVVVIDGTEYRFTDSEDPVSSDEGENVVSLSSSPLETWIGLRNFTTSVFYETRMLTGTDEVEREVGSAFIIADTVEIRRADSNDDTSVPRCVVDNTANAESDDASRYAVVTDEYGESYAEQIPLAGIPVAVVPVNRLFERHPLKRELSLMVASEPEIGDEGEISFKGVPGAVYRYNIEFDNDLKLHYPPVPRQSGSLMLNGVEISAYTEYAEAVAYFDSDSLYWRDNRRGRQPWPYPVMSADDVIPVEDEYREILHFISAFKSDTGPVTSIRPSDGSIVKVKRCGTDEDASVGDLEIDVDFTPATVDKEAPGHKVVKASRGGKLILGPVVEKLIAGPGITFSSNGKSPAGQGTFTISADGSRYTGDFETVALENAKLDSVGMFPYIRFLRWVPESDSNVPSGFVAKFHVPATLENAVYRVKFYATIFGETSFRDSVLPQTAGLSMTYSILPDYNNIDGTEDVETANLKTGLIQPDKPFGLNIPFGTQTEDGTYSYDAYDPLLMHNDASIPDVQGKSARVISRSFPYSGDCLGYTQGRVISGVPFGVRPGYTVGVRFTREAPTAPGVTPYTGPIGILNLQWAVEQVATIDEVQAESITKTVIDTVTGLKKAARISGSMNNSMEIVTVLQRLINALV